MNEHRTTSNSPCTAIPRDEGPWSPASATVPAPELAPEQVLGIEKSPDIIRADSPQELLRSIRRRLYAGQREFALALHVDHAHLGRLERGQEPRLSVLRRLIEPLGGSLELVARFEAPLAEIAAGFARRRIAEDDLKHERRVARNIDRRLRRRALVELGGWPD